MIRSRRAFTLIELLTVIAIIAILAGIVIGSGRRAAETGRSARAKAELAALSVALETYKHQYGDYPRFADARLLLQALLGRLDLNGHPLTPNGRVLLDLAHFTTEQTGDPLADVSLRLLDPWGQAYAYVYKVPSGAWTNPSFVLYSAGPDGVAQTALTADGYPNREADVNLDNLYATP